MNLIVNDDLKMVYVQDFDQTEWDAQKNTIPADYALQFNPTIPDVTLAEIAGDRMPLLIPQITYHTQTLGTGIISIPTTGYIQQLIVSVQPLLQDAQPTT